MPGYQFFEVRRYCPQEGIIMKAIHSQAELLKRQRGQDDNNWRCSKNGQHSIMLEKTFATAPHPPSSVDMRCEANDQRYSEVGRGSDERCAEVDCAGANRWPQGEVASGQGLKRYEMHWIISSYQAGVEAVFRSLRWRELS